MAGPSAGWFPDPMRRHQLRYWSGGEWTEHVADAGQTGVDPLTTSQVHAPPEHHEAHPLPPLTDKYGFQPLGRCMPGRIALVPLACHGLG